MSKVHRAYRCMIPMTYTVMTYKTCDSKSLDRLNIITNYDQLCSFLLGIALVSTQVNRLDKNAAVSAGTLKHLSAQLDALRGEVAEAKSDVAEERGIRLFREQRLRALLPSRQAPAGTGR